jgi:ribonuclease BN (tRNA processing enzyme)
VEVRLNDGTLIILDAGTGIRALGLQLQSQRVRDVHVLLSHLHLDHIVGLGFFSPLGVAGANIHLWGPRSASETLEEQLGRYLSPPLFPLRLSDAASRVILHEVPEGVWQLGSARVVADFVAHNGPTLGYRIEEGGGSLVYIPDHEPGRGVDLRRTPPEAISGYHLAAGADLLLHDAQYTADEYAGRVGWGHSSLEDAVTLALRASVRRLVLFHHDPAHPDDVLEAMEAESRRLWGPSGDGPVLAFEGMELELQGGSSGTAASYSASARSLSAGRQPRSRRRLVSRVPSATRPARRPSPPSGPSGSTGGRRSSSPSASPRSEELHKSVC